MAYQSSIHSGDKQRKQPGHHAVVAVEDLTPTAYILRFEREGIDFEPGQHILLGEVGRSQMREYSIYSGKEDPYLEVLVREVKDGLVSRRLRKLKPGMMLKVEPPVGFFTLPFQRLPHDRFLFIASGTGIAPFHSFLRSYDDMDYLLVHGIRYANERFGAESYDPERYITCTSRDEQGHYQGRLTSWLKHQAVEDIAMVYLCGNYGMILEAMDILRTKGIRENQMHAEVYF